MKEITSSKFLFCLIGAVMVVSFTNAQNKSAAKPNIIIFIADQWRGQALGFLHQEPVKTPWLDSLASHSLVLKNFISNYPVCSPARAMLLTGQYPLANHVYDNVQTVTAPFGVQLSKDANCWSDVLKQNGYSLGYIGKWHLDSPYPPYVPTSNNKGDVKWNEWTSPHLRHGFDYWHSYGTYDVHTKPMYWDTHAGRMDFKYEDEWEAQHDVDKAIEFLENKDGTYRKKENPFALVVSVNPPHTGYQLVPQKYYDVYKDIPLDSFINEPNIPIAGTPMGNSYRRDVRYYYACMTGVDEQVGRLLASLKANNFIDNTIILFISDHGNCLGKHGEITKNNIYEESLRVPFILYWKGRVSPGIDSTCLLSYPDIYPTLLDLAGLKTKIPAAVQGKSYASFMHRRNTAFPETQFFMGNIAAPDLQTGFRGIRTAQYKLAFFKKNAADSVHGYLFDIKNDPFELKNLYGQLSGLQNNLRHQLQEWLEKNKDPYIQLL